MVLESCCLEVSVLMSFVLLYSGVCHCHLGGGGLVVVDGISSCF